MVTNVKCTLDFIVVGGSIAGLSVAYFLRQGGHSVTIVEKHEEKSSFQNQEFSGLRIPPTLTRLCDQLPGLLDLLNEKGTRHPGDVMYQCEDLQPVAQMIHGDHIVSDLGGIGYRMPYSYLWNHLYELCLSSEVNFLFGFEVQEFIPGACSNERAGIISSSGRYLTCDMVIAANGHTSNLTEFVIDSCKEDNGEDDSDSDLPTFERWNSCRLSIPTETMKNDLDLSPFMENDLGTYWLGNGFCCFGGVEGPDQYGLNVYYGPLLTASTDMDWHAGKPSLTSPDELQKYDQTCLLKLLNLSQACFRSSQKSLEPSSYHNSTHEIVLIGDAARGCLINGLYNTTLAIEDGFIIGSLFSRISTKDQIVNILKGYNQIRKKRLEDVSDKKILFTFTLPPGPARDARNDAYRPTLYQADMDDEVLADLWNSYIRGLSYDPRDAVEEWWHFWGKHSLNS